MNEYNKVTEVIRQVEANEKVVKELQKLIQTHCSLWQPEIDVINGLIKQCEKEINNLKQSVYVAQIEEVVDK